ncbi:hypothetical protein Tco_1017159 [Tanacetum coccineum]|uniref:Uncharacterized protein n=1 Tax=Tanacetum coccineum TaxID=301880 RepID=A0ABQ5FR70_9ASTR
MIDQRCELCLEAHQVNQNLELGNGNNNGNDNGNGNGNDNGNGNGNGNGNDNGNGALKPGETLTREPSEPIWHTALS